MASNTWTSCFSSQVPELQACANMLKTEEKIKEEKREENKWKASNISKERVEEAERAKTKRREQKAPEKVLFALSQCSISSRMYLEENLRGYFYIQKLCGFF